MKVYLASDHAGLALKEALVKALSEEGHRVEDLGAYTENPEDDYPDFIAPCAARVAAEKEARGIVIGGSGHGEAMVANRILGVRAATFYGPRSIQEKSEDGYDIVRVLRMHYDANVLSLGARYISEEEACEAARVFLSTEFSGDERHVRRLGKF